MEYPSVLANEPCQCLTVNIGTGLWVQVLLEDPVSAILSYVAKIYLPFVFYGGELNYRSTLISLYSFFPFLLVVLWLICWIWNTVLDKLTKCIFFLLPLGTEEITVGRARTLSLSHWQIMSNSPLAFFNCFG